MIKESSLLWHSTSIKKDPNFSVLQVELVDSLSDILDKELVLIYGEHTDLDYNLNNSGYFIAKSLFLISIRVGNNHATLKEPIIIFD